MRSVDYFSRLNQLWSHKKSAVIDKDAKILCMSAECKPQSQFVSPRDSLVLAKSEHPFTPELSPSFRHERHRCKNLLSKTPLNAGQLSPRPLKFVKDDEALKQV